MVQKPIGEGLIQATSRSKECENVRVYRMVEIGMFKQIPYTEVVSTSSECFTAMGITSSWRTLPLPTVIKPESVDDVLIEAVVKNLRIHGTKVKV